MQTYTASWAFFSRLGEAQILLSAMVAALLWLARSQHTRPLAAAWLLAMSAVAVVTTLSKVAFIGWEVGYAPLDYTGVSGHAMFAAVVLPVLTRIVVGRAPRPWPRAAIAFGYLLAAGIAVSRVETGAHSVFESAAGFVLGGAAAALALRRTPAPDTPTPGWMAAGVVAWLAVLMVGAPPSRTHDWVTQLSLRASGREAPFTRHAMHLRATLRGRRHAALPLSAVPPSDSATPAGRLGGSGGRQPGPAGQVQLEPV